ncbi:MAG TPA: hypothetical protein VD969_29165 [Symbiobacteriaceae bacterium]|nr:hypothetical protein [Symbiobacteriaceae bacterium]
MPMQSEKAANWVQVCRQTISLAEKSFVAGKPRPDQGVYLVSTYVALGLCELILQQKSGPMIDAFRKAVDTWIFSVERTVTGQSMEILEAATLTRDHALALEVAGRIVDPLPALQASPIHHLSRLFLCVLTASGDPTPHRAELKGKDKYHATYGDMLGAILDGDEARLVKSAETYLNWHRSLAENGRLKQVPTGLAALPVLACLELAREKGLAVTLDHPYAPAAALSA